MNPKCRLIFSIIYILHSVKVHKHLVLYLFEAEHLAPFKTNDFLLVSIFVCNEQNNSMAMSTGGEYGLALDIK